MKTCTNCGEEKESSEFYSRKDSKDGLKSECKICTRARNSKYKKENMEAIKKQQKEKYHSDESIRERKRKYQLTGS